MLTAILILWLLIKFEAPLALIIVASALVALECYYLLIELAAVIIYNHSELDDENHND